MVIPSIMILFCTSILITLFQSRKVGMIAVGLNSAIFLTFMVILPMVRVIVTAFAEFKIAGGIAVSFNLIAFNLLSVIIVGYLVEKLNQSLLKESELQELHRMSEKEIRNLNAGLEEKILERTSS